jgi:hypothetical protein
MDDESTDELLVLHAAAAARTTARIAKRIRISSPLAMHPRYISQLCCRAPAPRTDSHCACGDSRTEFPAVRSDSVQSTEFPPAVTWLAKLQTAVFVRRYWTLTVPTMPG